MRYLVLVSLFFSLSASAEFCAKPLAGKWKCDGLNAFGKNIDIKVLPSGHGLDNGLISIENRATGVTELTSALNSKWTSSRDYYSVKGHCPPSDLAEVIVEFKDREIEYRKANGTFTLKLEKGNSGKNELHILEDVKFHDGSWFSHHSVCIK